jgi:hypothetical protein
MVLDTGVYRGMTMDRCCIGTIPHCNCCLCSCCDAERLLTTITPMCTICKVDQGQFRVSRCQAEIASHRIAAAVGASSRPTGQPVMVAAGFSEPAAPIATCQAISVRSPAKSNLCSDVASVVWLAAVWPRSIDQVTTERALEVLFQVGSGSSALPCQACPAVGKQHLVPQLCSRASKRGVAIMHHPTWDQLSSLALIADSDDEAATDGLSSLPPSVLATIHGLVYDSVWGLRHALSLEAASKHLKNLLRAYTRFPRVEVTDRNLRAASAASFWKWVAANGCRVDHLAIEMGTSLGGSQQLIAWPMLPNQKGVATWQEGAARAVSLKGKALAACCRCPAMRLPAPVGWQQPSAGVH